LFIEKFIDNLGVPGFVTVLIIGFSLLVYIIVKISLKMVEKKLKPLAEMLNSEVKSSFMLGSYINILNYGPEMHLRLTLGGKNSPPYLYLELLNPVGFKFKITRQQVLNEIFFRWGKEVKFNDVSLDEELLIRADKPEETSSYLMDSKRRDAIKYFFENGFTDITANEKGVYISKANCTEDDLIPEKVQPYLDNLNTFSRM
jgi:hypothetical protein